MFGSVKSLIMNRIWNEKEIEILIENYKTFGPNKCFELLNNKTKKQIISKTSKLGLSYDCESIKRYEYVHFSEIVMKSKNISEVTRYLGLSTGRGNRKTVTNYIKKYNLNISHFTYSTTNNINNFNGYKLSVILTTGSTYNITHLKRRLYDEGLKERKCEKCGQNEIWNSEKMSLILDHINGENTDNRIENLRIVCPNCNATLSTHGGKNRKLNKSKRKTLKNNFNNEISQRKVKRPSYIQLMNEINELGYTGTGKKYGVSDNAIRKWKKYYEKYECEIGVNGSIKPFQG